MTDPDIAALAAQVRHQQVVDYEREFFDSRDTFEPVGWKVDALRAQAAGQAAWRRREIATTRTAALAQLKRHGFRHTPDAPELPPDNDNSAGTLGVWRTLRANIDGYVAASGMADAARKNGDPVYVIECDAKHLSDELARLGWARK
jgi:hypothetical protein